MADAPAADPIPEGAEHADEETEFWESLAEAGFVELLTAEEHRRSRILAECRRQGHLVTRPPGSIRPPSRSVGTQDR